MLNQSRMIVLVALVLILPKEADAQGVPLREAAALILTLDDLPPGFRVEETSGQDNRQMASQAAFSTELSADQWLRAYEEHGRIGGASSTFRRSRGNVVDVVTSGADVYKSAAGATASFLLERRYYYGSKMALTNSHRAINIELSQVEFKDSPSFADGIVIQLRGIESTATSRHSIVSILVAWRNRSVINTLSWLVAEAAPFEADVFSLANVQQQRNASRER